MEIEGQYLTYEDYKGLGGTLDLMPFKLLEFEARKNVDMWTDNRLVNLENSDIPSEVKLCIFKIVNSILKTYEEQNNRGKTSETVGSYSVTYGDAENVVKGKETEIKNLIKSELNGVKVDGEHILYCGVK